MNSRQDSDNRSLHMSIANAIDKLRAQREWGFRRIAREAGLSGQTLFALMKCNANAQLSTLQALACAFDCDVHITFRPRRHDHDDQGRGTGGTA